MFRTRRSGIPGGNLDQSRSKKQRIADGAKILLDIMKESADFFPPLKSALGGVKALIKHYEEFEDVKRKIQDLKPQLDRFKQNITTTTVDGDLEETRRRKELTSALEEIEKRSQELVAKGTAARFIDKGGDSGEVVRLIERLQEAITHYQISQQQAIYHQITNLTCSFNTLLKLQEKFPAVKTKLDSVMARLDRLCSGEDNDDGPWDVNDHKRQTKLFDTLRLIKDYGNTLCDRINAQDYKECEEDVQAASAMMDDIRDAAIDYQMAQQRAIYDHSCRLIDAVDLSVLNACRRSHGAGYQHGDRKGCLRGTRETVLNEIESWTRDLNKSSVFWLNGLAGTGKSTIAQTVSERVFTDGLLGASFFCSRDFEDRSDLHLIFPTLAFQLAHKYPTFRSALVPLLRSNPDVVHESLFRQMEKLIVEPLRYSDVSTIIVIDALDECKDDEPSSAILSVLGRFVDQIPNVKFFITGRPEPRIKTGFRLSLLVDSTDVFVLHGVQPSLVNNDIRIFLNHELSELAQRRQVRGWPSDEHVDVLCDRAAGLFVYAVATVKFLDSKTHLPEQRLEVILGLPESTAPEGKTRFDSRTTLDSLYMSILRMAFENEDSEVDCKVRSIVGTVVLLFNPLPPSGIAELIGVDPKEVALFLTLLQSLLTLREDSSQCVKPFHKSFPDFITDHSRCTDARFWISPENVHVELVVNCLRVMNDGLEQNLLSLPDYALNSEVGDLETRINNRISDALEYSCRSWHNHLTRTGGGATDAICHLRIFLEEKFLAWLEVVSVLGAVRGAVSALEQMILWLQEGSGNEELLNTARDYFHFVTKFFEPISVSATHIYHSALELSPLSSIVRRLYYQQRYASSPRVIVGNQDSWDQQLVTSCKYDRNLCTWSPCGRFIAVGNRDDVEIRDSLSFELLSTLMPTRPGRGRIEQLSYSMDGRSIASTLGTLLVIWDIQTGGVAEEIAYRSGNNVANVALAWSLNGSTIGIISDTVYLNDYTVHISNPPYLRGYTVHIYNVASGAMHSPGTFRSADKPHLWACDASFRAMTTARDDGGLIINVFKVGIGPTNIGPFGIRPRREDFCFKFESFSIRPRREDFWVNSFSQSTYRISISFEGEDLVFDIQNSHHLLSACRLQSSCFSSDGSLFAGTSEDAVRIWKYTSDRYTPWRNFPLRSQALPNFPPSLQFSPTSSSLLVHSDAILRLCRLDGPSIVAHPNHRMPLITISRCGSYVVAGHRKDGVVTITNLVSQTPPHTINTGMSINGLALTGNVLLVLNFRTIAAWRLTREGTVDGVSIDRRAGRSDSIWTLSSSYELPLSIGQFPTFSVGDQTVAIRQDKAVHVYCTETGEVLEPTQTSLYCPNYYSWDMLRGLHYLHYHNIDLVSIVQGRFMQGRWMKDPEGKRGLWIPVEWRNSVKEATSSDDRKTVRLDLEDERTILIKF